ncbi:MAG: DNA repair protein RadC [Leptonema illini]|uniref:DNA repair protein RadC n=1 Tax=Leptonema illini TaxID=183 RepID=A0A833H1V2_9LEPT|nr:MAG: DNA repair protein RadC [Leptonema illini]
MKNLRLSTLSPEQRPREKARKNGVESLSDRELLALVLGRGHRNMHVLQMAEELLRCLDRSKDVLPDADAIQSIHGIGHARAAMVLGALEFARRRIRPGGHRIKTAEDAFHLIKHYADRQQEHFLCISLNGANEVICTRVVSIGLLNRTQVHPREVFSDPLKDRAGAVIIAHNHPSGNVEPGSDDVETTRRLQEAGRLLGIAILDHIVFSLDRYFSFEEHRLL